jgi:hypothetical protein
MMVCNVWQMIWMNYKIEGQEEFDVVMVLEISSQHSEVGNI